MDRQKDRVEDRDWQSDLFSWCDNPRVEKICFWHLLWLSVWQRSKMMVGRPKQGSKLLLGLMAAPAPSTSTSPLQCPRLSWPVLLWAPAVTASSLTLLKLRQNSSGTPWVKGIPTRFTTSPYVAHNLIKTGKQFHSFFLHVLSLSFLNQLDCRSIIFRGARWQLQVCWAQHLPHHPGASTGWPRQEAARLHQLSGCGLPGESVGLVQGLHGGGAGGGLGGLHQQILHSVLVPLPSRGPQWISAED